jgi:alanine racemase
MNKLKTIKKNKNLKNKTFKQKNNIKCNEIIDENKMITASINMNALKNNLEYLTKKSGSEVMPVLKSNAYGHGIIEISRICRKLGVRYIGVATIGEALQIRNSGDNGKILAWLYDINNKEVIIEAINKNIDIGIYDEKHISIISKLIKNNSNVAKVHLFVDTGINRNGIVYSKAIDAAIQITNDPKFKLVGIMSHLCCSKKKNNIQTINQISLFKKLRKDLENINIFPELFHIASTDGILNYDVSDFNMVRSGYGFYGLNNLYKYKKNHLIPALSIRSKIIQLKYIPKGTGIGYDRKYITHHKEYIAIVPLGYGDLLPKMSNKQYIIINGTKRKILGLENMDQVVIQAKIDDKVGDIAYFFGNNKEEGFTNENFIGNRVKYEYV